jgi:hypothetical protein
MNRQSITLAVLLLASAPAFASSFTFTTGNLVVAVEGCGVYGGTCTSVPSGTGASGGYGDNQASPLTLFQYTPNGTSSVSYVNSLVLPQTLSGANQPVSAEYGSSSEGTLQLSGNGQYLTIAGYGVNAATFDGNPLNYGGTGSKATALAQSTSALVPRVIALIDATGGVNSTTALTNVDNTNNPRSVYTVNGTSFYISGQGESSSSTATGSKDNTGGVFYATLGSTTATSITGAGAGSGHSQETNEVQVFNNTLYVSSDSTSGSPSRDYIGTLGAAGTLPTTQANGGNGPTMLPGYGNSGGTGKVTINGNGNGLNAGDQINLSPQNFFFANSTTLYVADSGSPKNTSGTSTLGDGGLQKWTFNGTAWVLDYTLSAGLSLVENPTSDAADTDGTTGLYGLTGLVVGNEVELFATNYTIADLDQTYLYGITDALSDTTASQVSGETFTVLDTAPADSNFKGVAFAPTAPEPGSFALLGLGIAAVLINRRRSRLA